MPRSEDADGFPYDFVLRELRSAVEQGLLQSEDWDYE